MTETGLLTRYRQVRDEYARLLAADAPNPRDFPLKGGYDADALAAALRRRTQVLGAIELEMEQLAQQRHARRRTTTTA